MSFRSEKAWRKTKRTLFSSLPLLLGMFLLIGLFNSVFKARFLEVFFHHGILSDSLLGGLVGSIAVGNPITSYVLAGELLKSGVSLAAVTSFILTWVTVGLVQLPAESITLGKKFAAWRNILSFISAIIIAFLVQVILS